MLLKLELLVVIMFADRCQTRAAIPRADATMYPIKRGQSSRRYIVRRLLRNNNIYDCEKQTRADVSHSFIRVPVIVAEISVQCVDIQDQCHGAAHQLCDHLSKTEKKEKKETKG